MLLIPFFLVFVLLLSKTTKTLLFFQNHIHTCHLVMTPQRFLRHAFQSYLVHSALSFCVIAMPGLQPKAKNNLKCLPSPCKATFYASLTAIQVIRLACLHVFVWETWSSLRKAESLQNRSASKTDEKLLEDVGCSESLPHSKHRVVFNTEYCRRGLLRTFIMQRAYIEEKFNGNLCNRGNVYFFINITWGYFVVVLM